MTLTAISISRLRTCDIRLQKVVEEVSRRTPIFVLCGFRNKVDQDKAFVEKKSKAPWPKSAHNSTPSMAVDIGPDPLDYLNLKAFMALAIIVKAVAKEMNIGIRWGGEFKSLKDYVHWELLE